MELFFLSSVFLMAIISLGIIIRLFQKKHFHILIIFIPIFLFWSVSSYFTIDSLSGWPTNYKIQKEFTLHSYKIQGKFIYVWITEDGNKLPRSHKIKYEKKLHSSLDKIKKSLKKGKRVRGKPNNGIKYQNDKKNTLTFIISSPGDLIKK